MTMDEFVFGIEEYNPNDDDCMRPYTLEQYTLGDPLRQPPVVVQSALDKWKQRMLGSPAAKAAWQEVVDTHNEMKVKFTNAVKDYSKRQLTDEQFKHHQEALREALGKQTLARLKWFENL